MRRSILRPRSASNGLQDAPPFGPLLARAYSAHWTHHSASLLRVFPDIAERFGISGSSLCDLACGEGTFAVGMAERGWTVIGVDRSRDMLAMARRHADASRVSPRWMQADMRNVALAEPVDVVTCWYNSLNYLTIRDDVVACFRACRAALRQGGSLLFDVYTLYGLEVEWADRAWIAVDTEDCFVASETRYDERTRAADVVFHGFVRERHGGFARFDEHHRHRGYEIATLGRMLDESRFDVVAVLGMPALDEPDDSTRRVLVAARAR